MMMFRYSLFVWFRGEPEPGVWVKGSSVSQRGWVLASRQGSIVICLECKEKNWANTDYIAQSVALNWVGPRLAASRQSTNATKWARIFHTKKKKAWGRRGKLWLQRNIDSGQIEICVNVFYFFTSELSKYYLCSVNCMYYRIFSEHSSCV